MASFVRLRTYGKRFVKVFLVKFGEFLWQQIVAGLIIGALILWQQVQRGLITVPAIRENWLAFLTPYGYVLAGLVAWHLARTAYLLHVEDQEEIDRLRGGAGERELSERPNTVQVSARTALHNAEEAVWVENALELSTENLKLNIAHDFEFRQKYYALPKGRYADLDSLRESIARDPILAATYVRRYLVSREILAGMIDQFVAAIHKEYLATLDFLFEMSIVNITDNSVSVGRIEMEAEIGGTWTRLESGKLGEYVLAFDEETTGGGFVNTKTFEQPLLPELLGLVRGIPLTRGTEYRGWLAFAAEMPSDESKKPVNHRVFVVDSLGGKHLAVKTQPLDTSGRIKHSPEAYARLRRL